jgi:hypothetical protein
MKDIQQIFNKSHQYASFTGKRSFPFLVKSFEEAEDEVHLRANGGQQQQRLQIYFQRWSSSTLEEKQRPSASDFVRYTGLMSRWDDSVKIK